jgi:hypothetical protein
MIEPKMGSFIEGLKHAFSLSPQVELKAAPAPCLERLARAIVERKLEIPAIFLLETFVPLNFLAAQGTAALLPLLSGFIDTKALEEAAVALEDRRAVRQLIERIENLSRPPRASEQNAATR